MEWLNLEDSVNALSLLGAAVILALTIFVAGGYIKKMKDSRAEGELAKESWDGISEFKNDIPIGWGVTYLALIVWGFWYWFVGYPLNVYSQIGEYNEEVKSHNAKFESRWANADKSTLVEMGQSIFLVQCSQCHGETTEGMGGKAANLTRWGRSEGIVDVVLNGGKGLNYPLGEMPAGLLDANGAKAVAEFIMAEISEAKIPASSSAALEEGRTLWDSGICAACHGVDGKGLEGQAPDLTKYGTTTFVTEVLEKGKKGNIGGMPAFKAPMLTEIQKKALANFIYSEK